MLWPALCVAVRKSILAVQPQVQDGGEQLCPVVEEDQGAWEAGGEPVGRWATQQKGPERSGRPRWVRPGFRRRKGVAGKESKGGVLEHSTVYWCGAFTFQWSYPELPIWAPAGQTIESWDVAQANLGNNLIQPQLLSFWGNHCPFLGIVEIQMIFRLLHGESWGSSV